MTLESRLKEIKERCELATEGPWYGENHDYNGGFCIEGISKQHKVDVVVNNHSYDDEPGVQKIDDSKFIAHARTDVPMLLEMVEEYRLTISMLKKDKGCTLCIDNSVTTSEMILGKALEKIAEKYNDPKA